MSAAPLRILAALLAIAGGMPAALAQAPARGGAPAAPAPTVAPPATAIPRPERTTASYGDWILRCELPAGSSERSCEVAQIVQDARGQTLAQMIARRAAANGGILLSVQVGTNATVVEPLRLAVEGQAGLSLPFRRCLPRGCFAEAQPPEAELNALARRTEPARLEFADGDGQPVAIPASLRGLSSALEALRAGERG